MSVPRGTRLRNVPVVLELDERRSGLSPLLFDDTEPE